VRNVATGCYSTTEREASVRSKCQRCSGDEDSCWSLWRNEETVGYHWQPISV